MSSLGSLAFQDVVLWKQEPEWGVGSSRHSHLAFMVNASRLCNRQEKGHSLSLLQGLQLILPLLQGSLHLTSRQPPPSAPQPPFSAQPLTLDPGCDSVHTALCKGLSLTSDIFLSPLFKICVGLEMQLSGGTFAQCDTCHPWLNPSTTKINK